MLFLSNFQNEVEAKPFLEFFYDTNFKNSYHNPNHYHHQYVGRPEPEKPVGGKERFKQICNVIHGISDCYA